mgnify:CR=1 FL=1
MDVIERDGFTPDAKVTMIVEGETPGTMAKSTGLGLLELPTIFGMLKPDVVVSVGDRFETMATAVAAAYMNIPVAHTQGGEVSGSIDESVRHAVTKLAHLHFPARENESIAGDLKGFVVAGLQLNAHGGVACSGFRRQMSVVMLLNNLKSKT